MKIKVIPPQHPDQINLDYMVDVQFGDSRIEQFELIASYRPDPINPLNAIRVGVAANLMGNLPFGSDQGKLTEMVEGVGTVFTPESLQFWPQYAEQPDSVRRMPQYAKILEKVKLDACKALMHFMKDKTDFQMYQEGNNPELDLTRLPAVWFNSDLWAGRRLFWNNEVDKGSELKIALIDAEGINGETFTHIDHLSLDEVCKLADLIPYWQKNITKNN